jgi:hypothetical protein
MREIVKVASKSHQVQCEVIRKHGSYLNRRCRIACDPKKSIHGGSAIPNPTLRQRRHDESGKVRQATWVILDGNKHVATGCVANEVAAAESKLAEYIAAKYQFARKEREIEQIEIADVSVRQAARFLSPFLGTTNI